MNKLYITDNLSKLKVDEQDIACLSVLNLGEGRNLNHLNEIELEILDTKQIKLGREFEVSYRIMLTIKKLLEKRTIDCIVFECRYIYAYFTMQILIYSGIEDLYNGEIENKCIKSDIKDEEYRFPYYWIKTVEMECENLFNRKTNQLKVDEVSMISIIIPYYNLGKYIDETIDAIQRSKGISFEIIIVNDGSNELESIQKLEQIKKDSKIIVIDQENQGLSAARNTGAKIAKGKYITFLDADDTIKEEYYKRAINVLECNQDIDIVYAWVEFFESKEEIWPTFNLQLPYLLLSNMSSAFYVIRREKYLLYGVNDITMLKGMEDYDSLISMYKNGCKGVSIPEPLVKYRYRLGSMSKSFNPTSIIEIYNYLVDKHQDIYHYYGVEIIKIMNANGPGYLWNNPTLNYPEVVLNPNTSINDVKYILIRMMNTKLGKIALKILKIYKEKF